MRKSHNFRELIIWKDAMELVQEVYLTTMNLTQEEKFGLKSQMERCAISLPSNIAEGAGRDTDKDFLRFLNIAMSSSYELETQLLLAHRLYSIDIEKTLDLLRAWQLKTGAFIRKIKSDYSPS